MVFKNCVVLYDGLDLRSDLNQVAIEDGVESLDATVFGNDTRVHKGGLRTSRVTMRGYVQYGALLVDPQLFDRVGADADHLVHLFPDGITEGSTSTGSGYAMKAMSASYTVGGSVGDLLPFDFAAEGRGVGV